MPRYRFRLSDGQVHESTAGVAAIRKAHPDAVITHRVDEQPNGEAALHPYGRENAAPEELVATDYASQKVIELLALAAERGIDMPSSAKKADVVAALQAHDEAVAAGKIEG